MEGEAGHFASDTIHLRECGSMKLVSRVVTLAPEKNGILHLVLGSGRTSAITSLWVGT